MISINEIHKGGSLNQIRMIVHTKGLVCGWEPRTTLFIHSYTEGLLFVTTKKYFWGLKQPELRTYGEGSDLYVHMQEEIGVDFLEKLVYRIWMPYKIHGYTII